MRPPRLPPFLTTLLSSLARQRRMTVSLKTAQARGEDEGLSWWQLDGAGLGRQVFLLWKFSNAERLMRVEDELACLATISAATVRQGLERTHKKTGQRRQGSLGVPSMCQAPAGTSRFISSSEQRHIESGRPNLGKISHRASKKRPWDLNLRPTEATTCLPSPKPLYTRAK